MIGCALLAALAILGLGEAQLVTKPPTKFHIPLAYKVVSTYQVGDGHQEPVRDRGLFLVGNITMGTPPQELSVLFDLGSPEMIVPSKNSTTNQCDKYHCFDGDASSTFHSTGTPYNQSYDVAGSDMGIIAKDDVQVGGIRVTQQQFLNCFQMDEIQSPASFTPFHGIIGMSFRDSYNLQEAYGLPFMYNAQAQGFIEEKVFAILYSSNNENGQLTIGGYNESLVSKDQIIWFDVAEMDNFWGFFGDLDISVKINGEDKYMGTIDTGVLIDSGNETFMYMPGSIFHPLNNEFKKCGYDIATSPLVKLSNIDQLPTLVFEIRKHKFTFKPSQYVSTHDDQPSDIPVGHGKVLIRESNDFPSAMVCGLFLRNFYSIFDMENHRVGLVPVADIKQ